MITGKGLLAVAFVAALAGCSNHAINDLSVNSSIQDYWFKEPKADNYESGFDSVTFQPRPGDECHVQSVPTPIK